MDGHDDGSVMRVFLILEIPRTTRATASMPSHGPKKEMHASKVHSTIFSPEIAYIHKTLWKIKMQHTKICSLTWFTFMWVQDHIHGLVSQRLGQSVGYKKKKVSELKGTTVII